MSDGDHGPAVRVELDATAAGGGSVVSAPETPARSWRPLVGVGVVLAAALALVVLALPDRDDGEPTAEDSPAIEPSVVADAPLTAVDGETPGSTELDPVQRTDLVGPTVAVARSDRGWIALQNRSTRGAIHLHRSIDGLRWSPIEATIEVEFDPRSFVEYSHLAATDDGFAMAMLVVEPPETGEQRAVGVVRRLVSPFGLEWTVDEQVGALRFDRPPSVISHDSRQLTLATFEDFAPDPRLTALLDAAAPGAVDFDVCFANRFGDRLDLAPCGLGGGTTIGDDDLADPAQLDEFLRCASFLAQVASLESVAFEVHPFDGGVIRVDDLLRPATNPALLADGSVAVVDLGLDTTGTEACDSFIDLPLTSGPAFLRFDAASAKRSRLPLPDAVAALPQLLQPRSLVEPSVGVVRFYASERIWDVVDTSRVEQIASIEPEAPVLWRHVLVPDGSRLVRFDAAALEALDVATGTWRTLGSDMFADDLATVDEVYVDDEVLFLAGDRSLVRVDLR